MASQDQDLSGSEFPTSWLLGSGSLPKHPTICSEALGHQFSTLSRGRWASVLTYACLLVELPRGSLSHGADDFLL